MIPTRDTVKVDSTISGEAVAMSVDTSALAHIMNVLTDLYADPELAIIREYSTNALDSHIDAGESRPIEVMTPTELRPLFTVRDYGTGLDADDIREIYSRYGASTKRQSNDAVGMLGLGCKSALAYVDQFTLIGIKRGQRVAVSVSRDESGAGTMTVLESGETEEADGVEVSIPAKRDNELASKAAAFFAHWEAGTVLLDGEPPEPATGHAIGDDFLIVDRETGYAARNAGRTTPRFRVIMGNVAYPAPSDYEHPALESLPADKGVIARVPIGAVAFVPSREGLQDAPATRKALDAALDKLQADLRAYVVAEIENAASKPDAARALLALRESLGAKAAEGVKFAGAVIPDKFGFNEVKVAEGTERKWAHAIWHAYPHLHSYHTLRERGPSSQGVRLDLAQSAVWLLDYTNDTWSASQRRKLDAYMEAHGVSAAGGSEDVLQTDADRVPDAGWLADVRTVSWTDVKAWRDPAKSAEVGGRTYAGTYPVHFNGRNYQDGMPAEQIAESTLPLYYYGDGKYYGDAREAQTMLGDCLIAAMPSTRVEKFRRMFPQAVEIRQGIAAKADEWIKALKPIQRQALATVTQRGAAFAEFSQLDAAKLKDPELKAMVKAAQAWTVKLSGEWAQFGRWVRSPASEALPKLNADRYPLLASLLTSRASSLYFDHVTMYCNAAYAADNK
jgi:hypothetical protein